MTKEERIALRNELFQELMKLHIFCENDAKVVMYNRNKLKKIKNNMALYQKYSLYIQQFQSEEEALYCMKNLDDIENHLCICGNPCKFYFNINRHRYKYFNTCGNKNCIQSKAQIGMLDAKNNGNNNKNKNNVVKKKKIEIKPINDIIIAPKELKIVIKNENNSKELKWLKEFYVKKNKLLRAKISEEEEIIKNKSKIKRNNDNNLKLFIQLKRVHFNNIHSEFDVFNDDKYFIEFISMLRARKNRILKLNEITKIFNNIDTITIKNKLKRLNLLKHFCDIKIPELKSKFKQLLFDIGFIKSKNTVAPTTSNNTINEFDIDFYLKNYNLGFDINDIASHNNNKERKETKSYYINKTFRYDMKGIRLIHLWEWELTREDLWSRLSKWIENLLNNHKVKIYARKCKLKAVSLKEEKEFLNNYHLQGYIRSEVCLGLYYDNQLVELMSFGKPRYNKNYEYELLRLCTKYGYSVIGGAQKLLKNYIKQYDPKSLISYCNLDKFNGKVYEELGFKLLKRNSPSRIWYDQETQRIVTERSLLELITST